MASFNPAKFSISSAESGIIIDQITFDYKQDKIDWSGIDGNIQGLTTFNNICEISIDGLVPALSAGDWKLSEVLTLTNAIPDHMESGVGGLIIIDSINRTQKIKEYEKISLKATMYPSITAV